MKLKQLEGLLGGVAVFEEPKITLEQFPTSPHIAARMIYTAATSYDDICGKIVADFGSGPGILSIACSLMGSSHITSFEVDQEALDIAWVNLKKLEIDNVDLVQIDIQSLTLSRQSPLPSSSSSSSSSSSKSTFQFDTVVMNPPFGTRNAGIDSAFVIKGLESASVVYSLHKTSTREVIHSTRTSPPLSLTLTLSFYHFSLAHFFFFFFLKNKSTLYASRHRLGVT